MKMNVRPSLGSVRTGAASTPGGAIPASAMMALQPAPTRMSALTTEKGTASRRCSRTCVRSAQATGTPSLSLNAAAMEGEAGGPTVRSARSRALWLSKNSAPMAEGL